MQISQAYCNNIQATLYLASKIIMLISILSLNLYLTFYWIKLFPNFLKPRLKKLYMNYRTKEVLTQWNSPKNENFSKLDFKNFLRLSSKN